jgi:hypothetical protein
MSDGIEKVLEIILAVLVVMALSQSVAALGLAVSPPTIEIRNALKGGEYERTITIFNSDEEACTYSLGSIGEMKEWIQFYALDDLHTPINEIMIPGNDKEPCVVTFNIPEDTATGNYTSTIYVETIPTEGPEGTGQVVKLKMSTDVLITVTGTQILTGTVKSITTTDTEIKYPLRIKVEFQNTGNVVAKPDVAVKITQDGTIIDEFTHRETGVNVNSREIIPVEWDTTGKESGGYEATVTVSLGGEVLSTAELQFTLLPVGTLSRHGDLTEIAYEGEPSIGKALRIIATFANIGEIETKAKFTGEVYVDGDLVDTIASEELLVPTGEAGALIAYLKIETDGSYTIKGPVVYEGKTTETKELSFVVETTLEQEPESEPEEQKSTQGIPGFGAMGAIMAIAIAMGYLLYRRRK